MSSNFLVDEAIGYISHKKVMSSCMLVFLTYHEKLGEVLSYVMFQAKISPSVSFSGTLKKITTL